MPKVKSGLWDGLIRLHTGGRVPTGLLAEVYKDIERETDGRFVFENRIVAPQFYTADAVSDRAYQNEALDVMIKKASRGRGCLCRLMTGTGKTYLAGHFFRRLVGRGVFVSDREDLARQSILDLEKVLGEPVGLIGAGEFNPQRITVAIVNTLQLRKGDERMQQALGGADAFIIDEVHAALNDRTWEVIGGYLPKVCIGLTATLDLANASVRYPAYSLCGGLAYDYDYTSGLRDKSITEGIVYAVDFTRELSVDQFSSGREGEELNTLAVHKDIYENAVVNHEERNAWVAALATRLWHLGNTVLVLGLRAAHIDDIRSRMATAGAVAFHGGVDKGSRKAIVEGMRRGSVRLVVASVGTFSRGISVDPLNVIIDVSQTKDPGESVQRAGRGGRIHPGKLRFAYIDLGDKAPRGKTNFFAEATRGRRKGLQAAGYQIRPLGMKSRSPEDIADSIHLDITRPNSLV